MKKILAISHDDYYGAPNLFLDLCGEFKKKGYKVEFLVLRKTGVLWRRFEALGLTRSFKKYDGRFYRLRQWWGKIESRKILRRSLQSLKPDIILCNTIATCSVLEQCSQSGAPVFIYLHELESAFKAFLRNHKNEFLSIPAHYFGSSEAVCRYLRDQWAIPEEKITLAYDAIDISQVLKNSEMPIADVFRELRKGYDYVVGGCGTTGWRKGTDLWLHIAQCVNEMMKPKRVRFVWIGEEPLLSGREELVKIASERKLLNLGEDVFFTGLTENAPPIYKFFDVFLLSSREDPCPLVMLENLFLKNPVVYFKNTGGATEVVRDDAGIGILDLDIQKSAVAICALLNDSALRTKMGKVGHERIVSSFSIKKTAEIMEKKL